MTTAINAKAMRAQLSQVIDSVVRGQRVVITRGGYAVAVMVPLSELTTMTKKGTTNGTNRPAAS